MVDVEVRQRVGWRFVIGYSAAYTVAIIVLISPLLVTLSLKINGLVGEERGPTSLALVAGVGGLVAMVANPLFGRLSDRTTSPLGMRRPWMLVGVLGGSLGTLVVAVAPSTGVVLVGWCIAQAFFNALLAALIAVLPDQVPPTQRGLVSGCLGICLPVASVLGTFLVRSFTGHQLMMFMAPCLVAAVVIGLFVTNLHDRRLATSTRTRWSLAELGRTFYVPRHGNPDFGWVFASKFLFVSAYAFLTTYEAFYLLDHLGSTEGEVPTQIFLATLAQSCLVICASLVGGYASDRTGRRKAFVFCAAAIFGMAMFVLALTTQLSGFMVGVAISGLGLGLYVAVDLALVVDVLPDPTTVAKDLGVFNIAGALPYSLAPAVAPALLAVGGYRTLFAAGGVCAVLSGLLILRVRRTR